MSAKPRPEVRKKPGPRLSRAVGVVRDEVRIGRRNWTLFGVAMGVIVVGCWISKYICSRTAGSLSVTAADARSWYLAMMSSGRP